MKKILLILFCLIVYKVSTAQTIQLANVSQDVFCSTGKDTMRFSVNYTSIPPNSNVVFYQSTNPSFNPYLGQGDSIGFINVGANTSGGGGQVTTTCPEILGIFIDACDQGGVLREVDNEYMVITSGNAGFNVSNLKIQLPNSSINVSGCPFLTPSAATMTQLRNGTCDATNLIAAGQADFIPANAIVIIFTGRGPLYNYNFSSYCSSGQPIYILQNSCSPGTANFVNNAPGSCPSNGYRSTTITVGSCTDKLAYYACSLPAYDNANPNANDGNYVINLSNTDTSSVTNGGIKNNAADKCNGLRFDSISGATIIKFPIPNDGSANTTTNFCNTGYHYIKAITNPNGTQPISNTIQFKLVCLDLTATPVTNTICSGQNATINNSSTDANATFTWTVSGGVNITGASAGNGIQINQTLNNTSTTKDSITYVINAKDDVCTANKTVKIFVNPILPKPNLGNDTAICGTISKVLTTGNATTTWLRDNVQIATNTASITATQIGQYVATIATTCGNVGDTINITQLSTIPKPNLGNDTAICGAISKILTTGNATTTWFKDNVQIALNTASITATQVGQYVATITSACGNVGDTINITQLTTLPKPNLGNDTAICGAISKVLTTGNATTTWFRDNVQIATNTASITATQIGQYVATITNACGNVADTIIITQITTQPKPNLGKDTAFCGTFSLPLSTGITTTTWFKDNVQIAINTASITATQTGTYRAVVTGSCGSASDTIVVTASPNINFDFGTNSTTVCNGGSISLDASTAYDSYVWSTGAVTHDITVTVPDKYWVDVFKGSCKGTDTILVVQIQPPVKPNLGNDTAFCGTFSKTLTTGNNATIWFKDLVQIATNTPSINATQAGTYIASITNSCATAKDTIVISQTTIQTKPNLGNDTTFCGAFSKTLTTGNATTTWFRDVTQIAFNTATITATQAGTYIATIKGSCGDISDTIVISQNAAATKPFIGNDTTICGNFSLVLTTGNAQTNWTRNNILITTSASITVTQGGTYIANVIGTCGNSSDTIVINNVNALSLNLGRDTVLCAGQTLVLNATVAGSGITYTWNTGEMTPRITVPAQFKRYDVVVSNGICSVSDTIIVDSTGNPNKPSLGNDTTFCGDFSLQLTTGENTFWSTGETGIAITVTKAGKYIAENRNVCGSAKDTINVTKFALPIVNLGRDTMFCDSIILTVGNGTFNSILWSTNDTVKSIIVTLPSLYTVKVTNDNCFKIDSINIARDCDFDVYLPTAFSPNNDNTNDVLVPLSYINGIKVIDFVVFNRWSEKVFESHNFAPNDKLFGWNGTFKGEPSAVDHYAYYYLILLQDGKTKMYKGTVALIR